MQTKIFMLTNELAFRNLIWFLGRDEMLRHKVQINAAKYTPMNDQLVSISLTSLNQKSRPFFK